MPAWPSPVMELPLMPGRGAHAPHVHAAIAHHAAAHHPALAAAHSSKARLIIPPPIMPP